MYVVDDRHSGDTDNRQQQVLGPLTMAIRSGDGTLQPCQHRTCTLSNRQRHFPAKRKRVMSHSFGRRTIGSLECPHTARKLKHKAEEARIE